MRNEHVFHAGGRLVLILASTLALIGFTYRHQQHSVISIGIFHHGLHPAAVIGQLVGGIVAESSVIPKQVFPAHIKIIERIIITDVDRPEQLIQADTFRGETFNDGGGVDGVGGAFIIGDVDREVRGDPNLLEVGNPDLEFLRTLTE